MSSDDNYEDNYDTSHPNIGVALIFNQMKFADDHETRRGSEKDEADLSQAYIDLGFDVRIYRDATVANIKERLKKVSMEDHSKSDCLIINVMTHGSEGKLMAHDGEYSEDDLKEHFLGRKCPTLDGKPKVLFIQACRGEKMDFEIDRTTLDKKLVKVKTDAKCFNPSTSTESSSHADFITIHSTQKGFVSFRDETRGSVFIQTLAAHLQKLEKSGEKLDIYNFLTPVTRNVSRQSSLYQSNSCKQTPLIQSSLTKRFKIGKKSKSNDNST